MKFVYEPDLLEYMEKKGRKHIVVEVVSCDHSDIEITELHVYLVNDRLAKFFKEEKKFRGIPTEVGEVLLPRYRLEYDETITFGLKTFLCFHSVAYKGIRV